jgi:hypothetical protein
LIIAEVCISSWPCCKDFNSIEAGSPAEDRTHALQQTAPSLDDLVGGYLQSQRHFEAKSLGRLEVDDQLELGRLNNRQI